MSQKLPRGWAEGTLRNIGDWCTGGTPSRGKREYFGRGVPWVKSGDLPDGPILKTAEEITKQGLEHSSAKLMPVGTISMALYGATIGKLGIMTFTAATNQACANVIPNKRIIDPYYLFFFLLSERQSFIDEGQGGAQPNISQGIVRDHPILIAPLNEQRRIVAKLEKLLDKVDACQKRLEGIPRILKRLRKSVLAAACSGRLTTDWREDNIDIQLTPELSVSTCEPEDAGEVPTAWRQCHLGDVISLKNGFAFRSSDYAGSGVPLVRISNIQDGIVKLDTCAKIPIEKANWDFEIQRGDLLVAMSGATTGKFGVYRGDERCLQNQRVGNIKIRDPRQVLAGYRDIYLEFLKRRIEEEAYGGAQPNISPSKIEALTFSLPPVLEQQEIVRRVEGLLALANQIEVRYTKAKAHVDKLTRSILAKAFRGELVPQDPNDPPASGLLQRTEKEKASCESDKLTGKKKGGLPPLRQRTGGRKKRERRRTPKEIGASRSAGR